MAGDRLELTLFSKARMFRHKPANAWKRYLDRYDSQRRIAVKRLRQLLDARPDSLSLRFGITILSYCGPAIGYV